MAEDPKSLAALVSHLRAVRDISQRELAKKAGFHHETISQIERGLAGQMRIRSAMKLLEALDSLRPLSDEERRAFQRLTGLAELAEVAQRVIDPAIEEAHRIQAEMRPVIALEKDDRALVLAITEQLLESESQSLRASLRSAIAVPPSTAVAKFSVVEQGVDGTPHRVTTYHPIDPTTAPPVVERNKKPPRNRA